MQPIDALERSFGTAAALFKTGELGCYLGCFLLQSFAALA